jgi:hypothetical protein
MQECLGEERSWLRVEQKLDRDEIACFFCSLIAVKWSKMDRCREIGLLFAEQIQKFNSA